MLNQMHAIKKGRWSREDVDVKERKDARMGIEGEGGAVKVKVRF